MALAQEVDQTCDDPLRDHGFHFFRRSSAELCQAIFEDNSNAILDRFVAELDNPRMQRAFLAAMDNAPAAAPRRRHADSENLFRGLPARVIAPSRGISRG